MYPHLSPAAAPQLCLHPSEFWPNTCRRPGLCGWHWRSEGYHPPQNTCWQRDRNARLIKKRKKKKKTFPLIVLPWILSVVNGYLFIIFFPEDLKVTAEGLVVLRKAGELSRGTFQDPQVLWGLHYSSGIFRIYTVIRNIPTPGSSYNHRQNSLPLTESITLMADDPSVFLAKHVYGPVSSFLAL